MVRQFLYFYLLSASPPFQFQRTAIMQASKRDFVPIVKLLLAHPGIQVTLQDKVNGSFT